MFEAKYKVSLSVLHPTIDPANITDSIHSLSPRVCIKAGENGNKRSRPAQYTHWLADLTSETPDSVEGEPLSSFLLKALEQLSDYKQLFARLGKEGSVTLVIAWFCDTNHAADVLKCQVLKQCGELGMDVELDVYTPPPTTEAHPVRPVPIENKEAFGRIYSHANSVLQEKKLYVPIEHKASVSWVDHRLRPLDSTVRFKLCNVRDGIFFGAREDWSNHLGVPLHAIGTERIAVSPSLASFRGDFVNDTPRGRGRINAIAKLFPSAGSESTNGARVE